MRKFILCLSLMGTFMTLWSQSKGGNIFEEHWFLKNYTATDNRYATETSPEVTDDEIIQRLNALPVVIEMPYNSIVREYIDDYTVKGRAKVAQLLGLGLYYNPIFEQALEEQGLPLELKYLPMIESELDPNAVSKHGAAGLWQFVLATAKGLGLEVNSLVDERRDPYLSSEMAASYLKGLYETYGDWTLAIAAYNCGPGNVNKALARAGGDASSHDFWSIYNYLPEETRGYVPKFIAINYVMQYYPEHNISPVLRTAPLVVDTLHVTDRIYFEQISSVLDIPMENLRQLNPQFRADMIPASVEMPRNLILPSQQIHAYLMSENDIKSYEASKYDQRGVVNPGEEVPEESAAVAVEDTEIWQVPAPSSANASSSSAGNTSHTIVHKVKAGESLASIAAMYEVSPEDIKSANNLRRNAVRVGQQLRIISSAPQAAMESTIATVTNQNPTPAKTSTKTSTQAKTASNPKTHKVKSGESLSKIASKYGVTVAALKQANGLKNDNIKAGATLKIPAKASSSSKRKSSKSKKR